LVDIAVILKLLRQSCTDQHQFYKQQTANSKQQTANSKHWKKKEIEVISLLP
jgi:hypothetical protein